MILSQDVLNRLEFYEAERFDQQSPMQSTIVLHWKRCMSNFWRSPTVIKTHCRKTITNDDRISYTADAEWEELAEQLRAHFMKSREVSKPPRLFCIKGGKKD